MPRASMSVPVASETRSPLRASNEITGARQLIRPIRACPWTAGQRGRAQSGTMQSGVPPSRRFGQVARLPAGRDRWWAVRMIQLSFSRAGGEGAGRPDCRAGIGPSLVASGAIREAGTVLTLTSPSTAAAPLRVPSRPRWPVPPRAALSGCRDRRSAGPGDLTRELGPAFPPAAVLTSAR
jgi:hypothetical protein